MRKQGEAEMGKEDAAFVHEGRTEKIMEVSLDIAAFTAAIAWPVVLLIVPSIYRAPVETFSAN